MKRMLLKLAIIGGILAATGLIVLVTGVVPINASSRHWAVTRWFLDFASDRSVTFYSQGIQVPSLDEPHLVTLGASIYESNCRFCHGQPGETQPPVAKGMTPTPPLLTNMTLEKNSRELFYVIQHGIKFAGMPSWPTLNRDEEVWPVVAFLQQMPMIDNATYRELIRHQQVPSLVGNCASCHGVDGNGRAGKRVPVLASQSKGYLEKSLIAYHQDERRSGIMMPIAHRLTQDQIAELAVYFAEQKRRQRETAETFDQTHYDVGKRLAHHGDRDDKIPSCVDCHGPFQSTPLQSSSPQSSPDHLLPNDDYPLLAGQSAWYIEQQLRLFALRDRGGSENAHLMHPIASKLSDAQRHSLAVYYSSIEVDTQ